MKQKSGRVIGIFGLPCSGKSTVAKAITEASKEIIAHISTGDIARKLSTDRDISHMSDGNLFPDEYKIRNEIYKLVSKRRSQGAEIIILDGCPRFDEQVKWMIEQQWIGTPGDGMLIQVMGDELTKRALLRYRDDQDSLEAFNKKLYKHQKMIDDMEKEIFKYGITYYTVANTELVQAVKNTAKLLGLRK